MSDEKIEQVIDEDFVGSLKPEEIKEGEKKESKSDFEIEVVDDTPPEDRGRTPPEGDDDDEGFENDKEIAQYSERVQKRIKKLKYEWHEERRAKEAAARAEAEAIKAAQAALEEARRAKAEAERYRRMVEEGEPVLVEQAMSKIDLQLQQARREYKEAVDNFDGEKLAEVTAKMTELQAEKVRVASYANELKKRQQQAQQQTQQHVQATPQAQQQRPQVSRRAMQWFEKNRWWFGNDPEMTGYASGLHQAVVAKGVQPDSDEYYRQIDETMRKRFPEKFGGNETQAAATKPGNVVAPASREQKTAQKIRLTQSQVRVAKRLGLTPEQYARELLKMQSEGN